MARFGTNWAGIVTYAAHELLEPSHLGEVPGLVKSSERLRPLGTRHSFNDLADTRHSLLSLHRIPVDLDRDVELDETARTVRVPGWLRYGDIASLLAERGWALANLASLPHISIAGAVATGTHGSGDRIGSLATQVVALDLVDGTGTSRRIARGDEGFEGAVVSLGTLGVVTHVTLAVEPDYQVSQTVYEGASWDSVLADLDAVTGAGDSVSFFTTWKSPDTIEMVWVKSRSGRDPWTPAAGFTAATAAMHPIPGIDPAPATDQLGVAGPWFDRLPHFRLGFTPSVGEEIQTEYLIPRVQFPDAIEAIRGLAGRIGHLVQTSEIRTFAADDLWLSPAYGTDAVGIHFTWVRDVEAVSAVLPEIERCLPGSARPHWGKVFADSDRVAALYPRWDDFRELRRSFDPEGRFVNDFIERVGLV